MTEIHPKKYTITDLIWSITKKIRTYDLVLIVGFSIVGSAFMLHASHTMVCSLVEARLDNIGSPLGRELALGDHQTSSAIFEDFKATLVKLGATEALHLNLGGIKPTANSEPVCRAGLFRTNIYFPITFGNEILGSVNGSVSYFSIYRMTLLMLLVLTGLIVALKLMTGKLTRELKRSLIDPILSLSKDQAVPGGYRLPSEVYEIQENIQRLKGEIQEKERMNSSLHKNQEMGRLAAQVAHDIQSPLTVLQSLVANSQKHLPIEERNLLRASALRIQKIANDLIGKYRDPNRTGGAFSMPFGLINSIVLEKNVILKNIPSIQIFQELDPGLICTAVPLSDSDTSRVLSNLLNNAIEAIKENDQGVISIRLAQDGNRIKVVVNDNGKGISRDVLERLRIEGGSFGKATGSGIGLQHAKQIAAACGGALKIESDLGKGTTVTLILPSIITPSWMAKTLDVSHDDTLVVLDDDESVHLLWRQRLGERRSVYLKNPVEFDVTKYPPDKSRYIFDLEILGCSVSGLDLIKSFKLGSKATLVTSYYDDPKVQSGIAEAGATLLPKFMIPHVPIVECYEAIPIDDSVQVQNPDLVLIDDDPLIHLIWRSAAARHSLRLLILEEEDDLVKYQVAPSAPVYVDKRLADKLSGIPCRLFPNTLPVILNRRPSKSVIFTR